MKQLLLLVVVVVVLGGGVLLLRPSPTPPAVSELTSSETPTVTDVGKKVINFFNPKKSAHYESNTPAHGVVLAGVPVNVVIDFNFDLAKGSTISVKQGGKEYGVGETKIDPNKLVLRRNIDPSAPDGVFDVFYKACWPDGSCHDGSFQFAIDRSRVGDYIDMRGQNEVTVLLTNISFSPVNTRVSVGTTVKWDNEDGVEHYINTDSHPAHTYYLTQNSKALGRGGTYETTFTTPGIYLYHCSTHADSMIGSILVE